MMDGGRLNRREFLASTAGGAAALGLGSMAGADAAATERQDVPAVPLAMWALTRTLESADVCRQLDAFSSVGWGVVLYPRWGLELEYLGEAWFDRIRFIVEQAAQRDMEVWLYDEFTWPSGHAKGLVTQGREDLEAQLLSVERDGSSRIESTPGSANLLKREATQRFIEVTHERYAAAVGDFFGSTVRAIFTDEPSLAHQHRPRSTDGGAWQFTWSDAMDAALGGDFRERAAAAADLEHWDGWREYWAAYARTFHDAWVAPIAKWCTEHGIHMTGHFLGEGSFGQQIAFNGSLRLQQGTFGIPGIDEIRTRTSVEQCEALTLASMAELPGRERMAEVFALGPPSMRLDTMRAMVDLCGCCGVDRYVLGMCPFDLSGGVFKREYLGIHGPHQPWFREYAGAFTEYVVEAAGRARAAEPLGIAWPSDEELWAVAGPEPTKSAELSALSKKVVAQAREAIRGRLRPAPAAGPVTTAAEHAGLVWRFAPKGPNSMRLDGAALTVAERPRVAELSIQRQLVRSLRINGEAVDVDAAPADKEFDLSYGRLTITGLLQEGENRFEAELTEPKPLPFLPALILWGDFAVDQEGRLVAVPESLALGDWRGEGFPSFAGTGCYRAEVEFATPPKGLVLDTGGYPARVSVNGQDLGACPWPPLRFDLRDAARAGRNEIVVEVTSTIGHLFVPKDSPAVGLLAFSFEA
ncbi:MAG: hypothetical protein JXR94_05670 [Candidatus Hydrogenedentes bacterium]|nr:hypothetical protein [Candidatus Hydrogenedentota bacterium]